MNKRRLPSLVLLVAVACSGCAPAAAPTAPPAASPTATHAIAPALPAPAPTPTPTPTPTREEGWLAGMTVEEKVGQLLMVGVLGIVPGEDATAALQQCKVGGVILFDHNVADAPGLATLTNGLKALNPGPVPLLLGVDEEGGRVSRMPPEVATLPSAYAYIQAGGDPAARGEVLAAQCRAFGFQLNFAPTADVWTNPKNTVIGDRAFATDGATAAAAGLACARAMAQAGIVPVVKHFPGHGDTEQDSHVGLPVVTKSVEALMETELVPFVAAIDGGVPAVMVGHILLTALDGGKPASLSHPVVTGLLREQLGFSGVVCTDDLTMAAVAETYGMGEAAVLAVEAGCDLLLVCHGGENVQAAYDALLAGVQSGRVSEARLDESVGRILALKAAYGLTDAPVAPPDVDALNQKIAAILP